MAKFIVRPLVLVQKDLKVFEKSTLGLNDLAKCGENILFIAFALLFSVFRNDLRYKRVYDINVCLLGFWYFERLFFIFFSRFSTFHFRTSAEYIGGVMLQKKFNMPGF